ncbi:hypothetical protein J3E69DRAFT_329123, partial [Trichoderma sp. SZMC 28015]
MEPIQPSQSLSEQFPNHWQASTADSNLTLHGFRRFKTTHLLNLRYLEAEVAEIDHLIYQLGLSLNVEPSATDRLGLKHCTRDEKLPSTDQAVSKELIQRLRQTLKEYDEAVIAFNTIMSMDTFALLDDEKQCSLRTDISLYEMYKTRLIRVDQTPRTRQDPLQRSIHQLLRWYRYSRISKVSQSNVEGIGSAGANQAWSSQNAALISDIISRVIIGVVTTIFLIAPLIALSYEPQKGTQIGIISTCIVVFSCLVSAMLRVSNLEMMIVTAAYAAIIAVFVSNGPAS